jgi:hypothetical protein
VAFSIAAGTAKVVETLLDSWVGVCVPRHLGASVPAQVRLAGQSCVPEHSCMSVGSSAWVSRLSGNDASSSIPWNIPATMGCRSLGERFRYHGTDGVEAEGGISTNPICMNKMAPVLHPENTRMVDLSRGKGVSCSWVLRSAGNAVFCGTRGLTTSTAGRRQRPRNDFTTACVRSD